MVDVYSYVKRERPLTPVQLCDVFDTKQCRDKKGKDFLAWVKDCVSKCKSRSCDLKNPAEHKSTSCDLKNPAKPIFTVGDLEDTIYRGRNNKLQEWGKFYLPDEVQMQVLGVVEGTSCPSDQLVLMTCEDENVYAYDGEELHLVASGLLELYDKGIEYPSSTAFYRGEAFKDMKKEDWAKVKNSEVGRRLDKQHHELVIEKKSEFLKNLRLIREARSKKHGQQCVSKV